MVTSEGWGKFAALIPDDVLIALCFLSSESVTFHIHFQ